MSTVLASYEVIENIVNRKAYAEVVWPDEYQKDGKWQAPTSKGTVIDVEPLLIDLFTASVITQVYAALATATEPEKKQRIFKDNLAKSRVSFGILLAFCWKVVK